VRVFDLETKRLAAELLGHTDAVTCVAYSPDGRWLASGSDDYRIRLWETVSGVAVGIAEIDTQPKSLAFSADGHYLFTANGNASAYQLEVSRLLGAGHG
jgi:WD40 repeat protein